MVGNPDVSMLAKQFAAIETLARNILGKVNSTNDYYDGGDADAVLEEYNRVFYIFNGVAKENGSKLSLSSFNMSKSAWNGEYGRAETQKVMNRIIIQCMSAQGLLNELRSIIPSTDVQKLNSLREQLTTVSKGIDDTNYIANIEAAIEESEKGHDLASALISGRVIICMLEKVSGQTPEEKVKHLEEKGIIRKDRKDTQQAIIKSAKLARNFVSHNMLIFPQHSESLSLLTDSVTLIGLLSGFLNEKGKQ